MEGMGKIEGAMMQKATSGIAEKEMSIQSARTRDLENSQ